MNTNNNKLPLAGFGLGLTRFFEAIGFIFKNKLAWVFLIPITLSLIFYITGFTFIGWVSDLVNQYIANWSQTNSETWLAQHIPSFLSGLIKILLHITFFLLFAMYSGYLILIFLSPLFAWLSEKTDEIQTGRKYPFNFKQFMSDIWRGIGIALRNMFLQTSLFILVFIASFIPVLNFITAPLGIVVMFLISSYFYGFAYMDYNCERNRLSAKESVFLIRKYKGLAIANGALFSITLYIPFIGVFLSTFASIIAVVGATLAMNELPEFRQNGMLNQK